MTKATPGSTVSIHYTGTLADGTTFDSSEGREPLTFELGAGQIIPGLEAVIDGMTEGESTTVTIPAAEAYGPRREEAMQQIPRASVPDHIPLDLGTQLQVQTADGQAMPVTVAAVTEETVTLDANHPLAGQDLTFSVDLVKVA